MGRLGYYNSGDSRQSREPKGERPCSVSQRPADRPPPRPSAQISGLTTAEWPVCMEVLGGLLRFGRSAISVAGFASLSLRAAALVSRFLLLFYLARHFPVATVGIY